MSKHAGTEWHSMFALIMSQEFILDLGHIHIGWTLAFAAFAFEAQIEHFIHPFGCELLQWKMPSQCRPQRIGAASRRVFFFTRDHVGRTHGPFQSLTADPDAAAHLDGTRKSSLS